MRIFKKNINGIVKGKGYMAVLEPQGGVASSFEAGWEV